MRASTRKKKRTRVAMICPCCGGEVTHQRYGFDMIVASPLRTGTWYVCDVCAAALSGDDAVARHKAEQAFLDYLGGTNYAPAS